MNKKEYLELIDKVNENGKFKDNWESLSQFEVPNWYKKSKFGIFIHWGVYSVPAFGSEWYPRNMYIKDTKDFEHHIKTYGTHDKFGYKDFIPMFKAEKFDANEWAEIFKNAGAKFVMPVAEHHDGFQMYASDLSPYNAAEMGPKKDILGLLKNAVEEKGMTFTASSHRAEHWWFFDGGMKFDSDVKNPENTGLYGPAMDSPNNLGSIFENPPDDAYLQDWLVRTCEIVDNYKPKIMYFDWWIQVTAFKPYLKKFAAYYYNRALEWGEQVTINYKHDSFMSGTAVHDIERGQLSDICPHFWQNDTSVAKNSWCYTEGNDYKKPIDIIGDLMDVVSKNGSLLLNIGPKSDGTIPEEDKHILIEVGKWLSINGEAVYDTKHWKVFGEGPTLIPEGHFTDTNRLPFTSEDIRFTFKNGILYATVMKWPEDGIVKIKSLKKDSKYFSSIIKDISILGFEEKPEWITWSDALTVKANTVKSEYPVCIKIILE